jgi:soluble lytic murein transglycosylase-like protein
MVLVRFLATVLPALLATAISVAAPPLIPSASAEAPRLIDSEGVAYFTNVPMDPRYTGLSGATSGWLRMSHRALGVYTGEIREISRQYGVDPNLVEAIVQAESAFNRTAVSSKGAAGLMQLMPMTAGALGVLDRFEPQENIRGGVRHLRYLLDRYHGSVALAVAAYNAGEGAVDAHRGIPPYPETEQYVQRVLRRAGLTGSSGSQQGLYRYVGPDDVVTYSNLPPENRPKVPEAQSVSRPALH